MADMARDMAEIKKMLAEVAKKGLICTEQRSQTQGTRMRRRQSRRHAQKTNVGGPPLGRVCECESMFRNKNAIESNLLASPGRLTAGAVVSSNILLSSLHKEHGSAHH